MRSLHPSPRHARWLFAFVCLFPLALAGCGDGETLYPVTGKVTLGGTPLTAGMVTLWSEGGTEVVAAGPINSDGTYEVFTKAKKGAPLGKYKITISTGMPPGPGAVLTPAGDPSMASPMKTVEIPAIYRDSKSTKLTFEVVANPTAGQYDLPLAK